VTAPLSIEAVPLAGPGASALSLTVAAHQTVALVGGEDSRLASLGAYVLGLDPLPGGRILVFGTAVADLPEPERLAFRRRVGYLPAGEGLIQNLSLRDNVALPLRFGATATPREIDGRVSVILAAARVREVADLRPAQVGSADRRRAAFARALAFDPALLVLERPFDGLSLTTAAELLEFARGGETAEGARRAILIIASELPSGLRTRVEHLYRVGRGGLLQPEAA